MRSVVGVREEDQLGVRQVLLQDVGVDGGDDDVVAAVDDERGVRDSFEVVEAVRSWRAPLVRRCEMRGDGGLRDRGVAVLGARADALEEVSTCDLARFRRREEDRKPHQILWLIHRLEERHDVGRELVHAVAAAWARAHEHQSADKLGSVDDDLLGDVSPHREAEEVDVLEVERVDERGSVARHSGDGLRCVAGAEPDAGVVGEDHLAAHGEGVGDGRVVVVEVAHEVLEQDHRRADRIAEASVGEASPVRFDESCRRRVRLAGHRGLLV